MFTLGWTTKVSFPFSYCNTSFRSSGPYNLSAEAISCSPTLPVSQRSQTLLTVLLILPFLKECISDDYLCSRILCGYSWRSNRLAYTGMRKVFVNPKLKFFTWSPSGNPIQISRKDISMAKISQMCVIWNTTIYVTWHCYLEVVMSDSGSLAQFQVGIGEFYLHIANQSRCSTWRATGKPLS